jgi:precorrin-6B methylase 1
MEAGFNPKMSVFICENLTLNNEQVTKNSLEETSKADFGSLCVMVIKAKPEEDEK